MKHISIAIVLVLSWGMPLYTFINNWLNPSFENSLGVPYGFFFGCVIHIIAMAIWFFVRRSRIEGYQVAILVGSFVLMLILTKIADSGGLSNF